MTTETDTAGGQPPAPSRMPLIDIIEELDQRVAALETKLLGFTPDGYGNFIRDVSRELGL